MRSAPKHPPSPMSDTVSLLLQHVRQVVKELHPNRPHTVAVTLDSALERELGLDSLGRVELLQRLERHFDLHFPDRVLVTAETPRDILRALQGSDQASLLVGNSTVSQISTDTEIAVPEQAKTLVEALEWHAKAHPERPHVHLYGDADQAELITYADLYNQALKIASGLQAMGLDSAQTVAMMLPTGRDFLTCFYGILMAGGIPVPIYPPTRPSQLQDHLNRQVGILTNAQSVMLITVPEAQRLARLIKTMAPELNRVVTAQELVEHDKGYARPSIRPEDIAFIQYTSGSTGSPKGVVLTHTNLLSNIRAMNQVANTTPADVFVSWLPLYHDMGLIGAWLGSVYCAYQLVLMSPLAFLTRPVRWLWAIHHHRGTISGAPNFAYELSLHKIDTHDLDGLDLSSWRLAFNGAEAINPDAMAAFSQRFAAYGFRPNAMLPVYGLAEGSLGLAFPPLDRGPRIDYIDREPFARSGQAQEVHDQAAPRLPFVSCGLPLPGHEIRIVDDLGFEAPERQVGRLEFRGPSATSGYYRNPEATAELFHDDWLNSGDLAYIAEGEVFLTGRTKDIIIRAGRNLYPHELEEAVGNVEGVRKGCVAVFGCAASTSGTERLVVVAETRETDSDKQEALHDRINIVAVDVLGTPPDDIVLASPSTVLKTSSGKIRRAATRELYEAGSIGSRQLPVWVQVMRLVVSGLLPLLRRCRQRLARLCYAGYVWIVVGLLAPIAWLALLVIPKRVWRQSVVRQLARLVFRLAGIPMLIQGLEHIPSRAPFVLVVNHASYLDALLLVAALPPGLSYIAKQELSQHFLSRLLMQRLGVEFVERSDAQRGVEDTARVLKLVQQDQPVVFFPEGTFYREPGLQPFRMGAFITAAQTGVAAIPAAVRGTRSMLRADQWFLRWGTLRVMVGKPIKPSGSDWASAIALRDAARQQILRMCGEPDRA